MIVRFAIMLSRLFWIWTMKNKKNGYPAAAPDTQPRCGFRPVNFSITRGETMKLTLNDLTVNPSGLNRETLLSSWTWAMPTPMMPVLITAMGDVFGQDSTGALYFLDTCEGTVDKVADSGVEFQAMLSDSGFVTAHFHPQIVGSLISGGLKLQQGECYSYKHPLVLGGQDEPDNIEASDASVHVGMLGQIHEQVKDLPPGTPISDIQIDMG